MLASHIHCVAEDSLDLTVSILELPGLLEREREPICDSVHMDWNPAPGRHQASTLPTELCMSCSQWEPSLPFLYRGGSVKVTVKAT